MDCINCSNDNLRDYPACVACEGHLHFTHRNCRCNSCARPLPVIEVITGWTPASSEDPSEWWAGIDCPVCENWHYVDWDEGPRVTCGVCETVFAVAVPAEVIPFPQVEADCGAQVAA